MTNPNEIQFGLQFPDSLPLPAGTKVDKHIDVSWPRVPPESSPHPVYYLAARQAVDFKIKSEGTLSDSIWLMYESPRFDDDNWHVDAIRVRWADRIEYPGWRVWSDQASLE